MRGRRTMQAPAAGALLVGLLAPAVAEAQLFPNLPTRKRARIDCSQELPVYGLYRNKYYGYFPTCWRQFPPGWGCPSNESPDWEAELERMPLDIPEEGEDDLGFDSLGPDPFSSDPGTEELPKLRERRSPFELDEPGSGRSPFEESGPAPSPFQADPFAPSEPDSLPGGAPEQPTTPVSPFDLNGAAADPTDLPSLTPPVTEGESGGQQEPLTSNSGPSSGPELAVVSQTRPRPVRLPRHESSPAGHPAADPMGGITGPLSPSMPGQGMPGQGMMAPQPIGPGDQPIGAMTGAPGSTDPRAFGVVISDPSQSTPGPIPVVAPEHHHRRGFLSRLLGHRH